MTSAILHLILAGFMTVGAVFIYFKYYFLKKNFSDEDIPLIYIFWFYIFFIGFHLSLSLPLYLFSEPEMLAWGYNLSIIFMFLFEIPLWLLYFKLSNTKQNIKKITIITFSLMGLIVTIIQSVDLNLPIIDSSGLIIWNNNLIAGWITFISTATLAVVFPKFMIKNLPKNMGFISALKSYTFSLGGILFALACSYFIATTSTRVIIAFVLVYLATFFFSLTFFLPNPQTQKSK